MAAVVLSLTLVAPAFGAEPHGTFVGSTTQGPIASKPSIRIRAAHGEIRKIYLAYVNTAGTRVTGTVRAIGSASGGGIPESGCALLKGPVTFSIKVS